jgi:predicted transglutaminase-like cysteine proteinase
VALPRSRQLPAALCVLAMLIAGTAAHADGLDRSPTIASGWDYGARARWSAVIERFARQEADPTSLCAAGTDPAQCPAARWARLIATLSQLPLRERVARVNAELNRLPYVPAAQNWGDPSYWETPYEFLAKGGQCEDYAIAKFLALEQSGVPESSLRFVVVHDSVSQLDHAITLVMVDGENLVLDNQTSDIVPASDDERYTPYYSLNDSETWVYAQVEDPISVQATLRPGGSFSVAHF